MHRIVYAIFWMLVLWFFVWPVASFCAWFWIVLQPLEACFPSPIKAINTFLEKLITWPRDFGHAIANCQTTFPAPF
ncbi:hypothetical protein IV203_035864 [Nitzschia inconspicua]|uniref:Uncharacterized protein n=1 Tax=Nitzschia inconspicua TaxID=303405 RepID=A0A9K3LF56_9STRA|nr:hypothetical protein IV203_035864 [Nitzschia inconspicua]